MKAKQDTLLSALFLAALMLGISSCSTPQVKTPKGTSKGYSSARLVSTTPGVQSDAIEDSPEVHTIIQSAIRSNFAAKGMAFGGSSADLIVSYLLISQNPASTSMNQDYFGGGRDTTAIMEEAHKRGVIENKRPDDFEAEAIVIDILDAKTNELIYRDFATRDILENASDAVRASRINGAVAEALNSFFK